MKKIVYTIITSFIIFISFFGNQTNAFSTETYINNFMNKFYSKMELELPSLENRINKLETIYSTFSAMDTSNKSNTIKTAVEIISKSVKSRIEVYKQITTDSENLTITIIDDKRCANCNTEWLVDALKDITFLDSATYVYKDFSDEYIKDYLQYTGIQYLPAVVFSTNDLNDPQNEITQYLDRINTWEYNLRVWSTFDPLMEICGNWIDDNGDWKTDCEDTKCSNELSCMAKVDKPKAELFVMSYCPYWLQAQKGFLETMIKLKDVADLKIRFVPYLMHWISEWEENLVQHCIQKEQNDKYTEYLECFLKAGQGEICRDFVNIDDTKLQSCISSTKTSIDYDSKLSDSSTNYPEFSVDKTDADSYWVQWSPTFVLNWIKVDNIARNAKAYTDIICSTFKVKPAVCSESFSTTTYDPGFWFTSWWEDAPLNCGN